MDLQPITEEYIFDIQAELHLERFTPQEIFLAAERIELIKEDLDLNLFLNYKLYSWVKKDPHLLIRELF